MGLHACNGFPFEEDVAGNGFHNAHDGFHGGGFTGTVGADKGDDLSFRYGEVDAFQSFDVAVGGFHIFQFKKHHSSSFPR